MEIEIRDAYHEYAEMEEGVEGGRYSSCADLSEDDDSDNGDNEYSRGGGLEYILWPPDMQHHVHYSLTRKRRQEYARQMQVEPDDEDDEGFDGERDDDYLGI